MANPPRKPVKTASPGSDEISRELDLLNVLNKEGGSPAQLLGSNVLAVKIKGVISTQCPTVDAAIGRGGIPLGRLTLLHGKEASGKTILALHCVAETQRVGGMAIYADAEHKLDPDFAARIGVDINRLVIIQPDHLEKFFDTIEKTIDVAKRYRTQGKSFPILVVLDSINAIGTKTEMDADWDDNTFAALTAGYYSRNLKKLIPMINSEEVALLFISQEREKIGVMFGCFHYDARVNLANGKTARIGQIVNQKQRILVRSFDEKTGLVVNKKVVGWYDNGVCDRFIQFSVERASGRGIGGFGITGSHVILTPIGERKAKDLRVGDYVFGAARYLFNAYQMEIAAGSVLGDGSLRRIGRHTVSLRIGHGEKQNNYCRWKSEIFANIIGSSGRNSKGGLWFDLMPSRDLYDLFSVSYIGKTRKISELLLNLLTLRSVAIWYMDDGNFSGSYDRWGNGKSLISAKSYEMSELSSLADRLVDLGFPRPTIDSRKRFIWYGKDSFTFQSKIAEYIHPSMGYKIHPKLRSKFVEQSNVFANERFELVPVKILGIHNKPPSRSTHRFDIEVEDTHTYFVDGVCVHNSKSNTGGGKAPRYYASLVMEVFRKATKKDDHDIPIGIEVEVNCAKNQIAPPFRKAEFFLSFDNGIDYEDALFKEGRRLKKITQTGSWFQFGEKKLGHGADNSISAIREDKALKEALKKAIL